VTKLPQAVVASDLHYVAYRTQTARLGSAVVMAYGCSLPLHFHCPLTLSESILGTRVMHSLSSEEIGPKDDCAVEAQQEMYMIESSPRHRGALHMNKPATVRQL
jgi:hypothetical protein